MIRWQVFPKSHSPTDLFKRVVDCFERVENEISSDHHRLDSNQVLSILRPYLKETGFHVEERYKKISCPVLFGPQGKPIKSFEVDAYHEGEKAVFEVEAGRAVLNNQFLKDLFEACMMQNVEYLILAVRKTYLGKRDFDTVVDFFETMYASDRMKLPLKAILLIGY